MEPTFDLSLLCMLLIIGSTNGSTGWHALGNSAYRYVTTLLSFQVARDNCHEFGGDLAQLKTQEINDFVQILIGNQAVWFGLTDLDEECTYKWIDGSLLDNSLSLWEGNETVICQQYKDCIQLEQGTWRENNCSIPLYFVCERSGVYTEQLTDVHLYVSDPYASADKLKVFLIEDRRENQTYSEIQCSKTAYEMDHYASFGFANSYSLRTTIVTGMNSSSLVLELSLAGYPPAGKLECRLSSENDDSTTVVSAVHLSPDRELQPSNGRFTVSAYPGTNSTLTVTSRRGYNVPDWYFFQSDYSLGFRVSSGFSYYFSSVREEDQGTYVTCEDYFLCSYGLDYYSVMKMIVYDCPAGRWGSPNCMGVCDPCYNGGICHDLSGSCICPPGFTGKNCLQACGEHRFGSDCDVICGPDHELNMTCAGSQVCRPDPYGCNCLSGYTGIYCNETCQIGQYGVDCKQDCHCSGGSACDIFSGECTGDCADGWSGPSCQVPEVCPGGFYGGHCSSLCHCPDTGSCDPQTGYCIDSYGVCAIGYMADTSRNTFCNIYAGCFDSCSKTCHCSEGALDCNSVTGECFSGKCLYGWTGPTCQIAIPRLAEPPTSLYRGCDTIAIIWNAWDRDRDMGEGPIGGYDIYLKSETPDWFKVAFVTQYSATTDVLRYVLIGLEQSVEYSISVTPVHIYSLGSRPMDVDSGQKLVIRTLQCWEPVTGKATTMTTEQKSSTVGSVPKSTYRGPLPWALFGVTLVLFLVCGGVLFGFWLYRKKTPTPSTASQNGTSKSSPSGTEASTPSCYVYENATFSAEAGTSENTYQGLYMGPKTSGKKVSGSSAQDDYSEVQVNPPEIVYENTRVKAF